MHTPPPFRFEMKRELPRTTTKAEYKAAVRWLRLTRRIMTPYLESTQPQIHHLVEQTMMVGTAAAVFKMVSYE